MKILIFTEGTALMQDPHAYNPTFRTYIPQGRAVNKIKNWHMQGSDIYYLTSRTTPQEIDDIRFVLHKFEFPMVEHLLWRKENEEYKDVAEHLIPDIFIEDDCASIGADEITFPHIRPEIQKHIHSIIVPEFAGIDHLPDDVEGLNKS